MHSYLVHSSCKWFAQNNTVTAHLADSFKCGLTVLALRWNLTNTYFVAHDVDFLIAFNYATTKDMKNKQIYKRLDAFWTYSGKRPSTRQTYSFCTWRVRICSSNSRAFSAVRPNKSRPDVRRSNLWMVRRFFRLCSLARMKTTVLCLYLPQGCTYNIRLLLNQIPSKLVYLPVSMPAYSQPQYPCPCTQSWWAVK